MKQKTLCFLLGAGLLGFACATPPASPAPGPAKPAGSTGKPAGETKKEAMRCGVCGMHVEKDSENRYELTGGDGKHRDFCSSVCAIAYSDKNPPKADSATVYDYETHQQIPAATAFHLYASKLDIAGAMPPPVASFASRPKAEDAAKKHGGKVLTWDELRTTIRKTDDYKDSSVPKEAGSK